MNNNCQEEIVTTNCSHNHYGRGNGLLIVVVLYILLAILLSSFRTYY